MRSGPFSRLVALFVFVCAGAWQASASEAPLVSQARMNPFMKAFDVASPEGPGRVNDEVPTIGGVRLASINGFPSHDPDDPTHYWYEARLARFQFTLTTGDSWISGPGEVTAYLETPIVPGAGRGYVARRPDPESGSPRYPQGGPFEVRLGQWVNVTNPPPVALQREGHILRLRVTFFEGGAALPPMSGEVILDRFPAGPGKMAWWAKGDNGTAEVLVYRHRLRPEDMPPGWAGDAHDMRELVDRYAEQRARILAAHRRLDHLQNTQVLISAPNGDTARARLSSLQGELASAYGAVKALDETWPEAREFRVWYDDLIKMKFSHVTFVDTNGPDTFYPLFGDKPPLFADGGVGKAEERSPAATTLRRP